MIISTKQEEKPISMFQTKTFFASVSHNLDTQVRSEERPSDVEFTTQRISRRSLFRHTALVGMVGGVALIVAACGNGNSGSSNDVPPTPNINNSTNDSSSSPNNIPTPSTNDNGDDSGSSSSGSNDNGNDNGEGNGIDNAGNNTNGNNSGVDNGNDDSGDDDSSDDN